MFLCMCNTDFTPAMLYKCKGGRCIRVYYVCVHLCIVSRLATPQAEAQARKEREGSIPPADYFRILHGDQYATYDDDGVPLTLQDGTELSKSQRKNLLKVRYCSQIFLHLGSRAAHGYHVTTCLHTCSI